MSSLKLERIKQRPGSKFRLDSRAETSPAGRETIYASIYRGSTDKGIRSSKRTDSRLSMTSFKQIEANHRYARGSIGSG